MDGFKNAANESINILIVEDSPTQAVQLRYHLESEGYSVTVARNGREALALTSEETPSIVISDVVMPEMDGYTLCQNIKARHALKDVPVILLTSLSSPHDVLRGLECGADNFIRKPYDAKYLLSRIDYILANLQLRKDAAEQDGVPLYFGGRQYFIAARKHQILDLLTSTYEGAIQINAELATKQKELTRERDLLHTLMDNVPDWIYFKDTSSRYTAINKAAVAALSLPTVQEALGKRDVDLFSPEHAQGTLADEQEILDTGRPVIGKVEQVQLGGGSWTWLSTTKMVNRDASGSVIGTFGVSRDITQAKLIEEQIRRANEELEARVAERTDQLAQAYRRLEAELAERIRAQQVERETQARFRFLFANNPLPMWVYDQETNRFLEVNDAAIAHYGYSAGEFAAMRISDIAVQEEEGASAVHSPDLHEGSHRLRSGKTINVEITSHALEWLGRKAILVVAHDITERKRIEREFLFAQKMEAVGRLAAGVAHDFNNLLTVIGGYSSFILEKLEADNPLSEGIREINRAGERAASLTRQLLAFSRRQILQPRLLDLNQIVTEMERMLRRLIGEDIKLVTVLSPELGQVKADAGHIEQVIMNLAVNARDAMPKGGQLMIETRNEELHESITERHLRNLATGPYVQLSITDTGTGMDAATQSRIFDPFFTTKGEAGTGLGLSTVYGIIQQSRGGILVYSEVGHGTCFKIYLPRAFEAAVQPESNVPAAVSGGSETILVVEDEDAVRTLVSAVLKRQGYTVLRARSGSEALRLSQEYNSRIDLMITDVIMPAMSGSELATQLAPARPDMKVLFMSGYTDNAIVHHGVLNHDIAFLGKPFAPVALTRKVRETLDSPESRTGLTSPHAPETRR